MCWWHGQLLFQGPSAGATDARVEQIDIRRSTQNNHEHQAELARPKSNSQVTLELPTDAGRVLVIEGPNCLRIIYHTSIEHNSYLQQPGTLCHQQSLHPARISLAPAAEFTFCVVHHHNSNQHDHSLISIAEAAALRPGHEPLRPAAAHRCYPQEVRPSCGPAAWLS